MKTGYLFAGLGILTLVVMTCQAQPPRGGNRVRFRTSRDTLFRLLEMRPVRDELGMRGLQIEMLNDLQADLGEQRRIAFSSVEPMQVPRGPDGPREPAESDQAARDRFEEMRAAIQKIRDQGEKLVFVILDSDQTKRLNELRLQDEGTFALDRQDLREQLAVTDEQFKKIQELRRTEDDPALSRSRRRQKLDKVVLELLKPEQQVKFQKLQGEVFEFPLPLPADLRGLSDPNRRRPPRN